MLTAKVNTKGVLDVDTVKGCTYGMKKYPCGGCYGLCYANKIAMARGFDFSKSVSRTTTDKSEKQIENIVKENGMGWFRIGVSGDPSHDWHTTSYVCSWLCRIKTPVVVTKHWTTATERVLRSMANAGVVLNTSISALDNDEEIQHRITQYHRYASFGGRSFLRVVTALFGTEGMGPFYIERQKWILSNINTIDTPLRIPANDPRVMRGEIVLTGKGISKHNELIHTGICKHCKDKCGTNKKER